MKSGLTKGLLIYLSQHSKQLMSLMKLDLASGVEVEIKLNRILIKMINGLIGKKIGMTQKY